MENKGIYIKSIVQPTDALVDYQSILLLGRSNVGKSSLINFLTNRKHLAKTSGTPGKTKTLNYFLINNQYYLVDAPGYGYARQSKQQKAEFIGLIEKFITKVNFLRIFLLIDFFVGPTKEDLEVFSFLKNLNLTLTIIATKVDQANQSHRHKQTIIFKETFAGVEILLTSSSKKIGLKKLNDYINSIINNE